MQNDLHIDMHEATRLTRTGHLLEATALIQRALRGATSEKTDSEPGERRKARAAVTIEGVAEVVTDNVHDDTPATHRRPTSRSGAVPTPPADFKRPVVLSELLQRLQGDYQPLGITLPSNLRAPTTVPVVPEGARFENKSYTNAAGTRAYKIYVPSSYRGQSSPLVVMLHGCTQDPDDFAAGTRMNEHAEAQGFLVAYPAQPSGANPSRCWNWFRANDQMREGGEPSLIAGITRQVMTDYSVDPQRVYLAGMSAGGAMAMVISATHSDLYAAVGVHSGLAHGAARDLPTALAAMRQGAATSPASSKRAAVPTIVFHGDQDSVVHRNNGERIVEQALGPAPGRQEPGARRTQASRILGGRHHTCTSYRDTRGQLLVEHWVIHGAGHAWSGGSQGGTYTDPRGADASAEMLRFFFANTRSVE